MRRLLAVAACVAALVVGVPATASADLAAPAAPCAAGADRVSVPAGFAVTACIRDGRLVVTDTAAVPVVARATGDVGAPVPLDAESDAAAVILRAATPDGQVLMPGEAAAWPLGNGEGRIDVAPLRTTAIVQALTTRLPRSSGAVTPASAAGIGALVGVVGAALDDQGACQQDGTFLAVAACGVTTATAIGQALRQHVPSQVASVVRDVVFDRREWRAWMRSATAAERAVPGDRALVVLARVPATPPSSPAAGSRATAAGPATTSASPVTGGSGASPSADAPASHAPPPPATSGSSRPGHTPSGSSLLQALIERARQAMAQRANQGRDPQQLAPAPGRGHGR